MLSFSIEAVVFGRNDEYEPNWSGKLFASLAHNRRLFEGSRVDFRVAFVEWNPPSDRPLLAPALVEMFPFVRVIVVDPAVHRALCESTDLQVMTTFPFNVGLRSSNADFTMITCGDEFYGTNVAHRIIQNGLRAGCLYRAERVNIREDIDFLTATPDILEDPKNIVSIDTCSEPPHNRPPYTNASGDFMLLDAGTMAGIRGMDEGIKNARLHTDSRLATTAMIAGADCELLGQTFHINHRQTYRNNIGHYPGQTYKWDIGLPYVNPPDWGLSAFDWQDSGERIQRVSLPGGSARRTLPEHPSPEVRERERQVAERLRRLNAEVQSEEPYPERQKYLRLLDIRRIRAESFWDSNVVLSEAGATIQTAAEQWSYAALCPIEGDVDVESLYWLLLDITLMEGSLGICFRVERDFVGERYIGEKGRANVMIPVPLGADNVIFRNIDSIATGSRAVVHTIGLVSQKKNVVYPS